MAEYMKKTDYSRYLSLGHEFEECLIACAQEINMLSYGRELVGEFNGDLDIYEDDMYFVQFEDWSGCETEYDSVYVPEKYIFDEGYREYYRKHLVTEREERAEARLRREAKRKAATTVYRKVTEGDERAEYERLKARYGDE